MDAQLQDIIDKIHQEGVKSAEEKAAQIIKEAKKKAASILVDSRKEAESIISDATAEADRARSSGEAALAQAGRDLVLSVRSEISALFQRLVAEEAGAGLSPERMGEIVAALITKWGGGAEILVAEKDVKALESALTAKLAKAFKSGVTVRPLKTISAGFRIGRGDGSVHYDFSDESIAEMLSQYLNPKLAEVMKVSGEG